jgi:hypothetical protein
MINKIITIVLASIGAGVIAAALLIPSCIDEPKRLDAPNADSPRRRVGHIVIYTSTGCAPCRRLRSEWGTDLPWPVQYLPGAGIVSSVPTIIVYDQAGHELGRKVGYISRAKGIAWIKSLERP